MRISLKHLNKDTSKFYAYRTITLFDDIENPENLIKFIAYLELKSINEKDTKKEKKNKKTLEILKSIKEENIDIYFAKVNFSEDLQNLLIKQSQKENCIKN